MIGFAKDLAPHPDRVWDLSCECGAEGCYEKVCLTIAEYHRHCGKGTYVVAPGHAGGARVLARTDTFAVIVP